MGCLSRFKIVLGSEPPCFSSMIFCAPPRLSLVCGNVLRRLQQSWGGAHVDWNVQIFPVLPSFSFSLPQFPVVMPPANRGGFFVFF